MAARHQPQRLVAMLPAELLEDAAAGALGAGGKPEKAVIGVVRADGAADAARGRAVGADRMRVQRRARRVVGVNKFG